MTQKECLDSVKLALSQQHVALSLDDATILNYINLSRRDVGRRAFPYNLAWYLVEGIDPLGSPQLPMGMLGGVPVSILCTNPDDNSLIEARYAATPNEFWYVEKNSFNSAKNYQPTFFIGDSTTNVRTVKILPTTIATATMTIYKLPADLAIDQTDYATDLGVPPNWDISVRLGAQYRCLQKLNEKDKMAVLVKQYQDELKRLEMSEQTRRLSYRQNLQSLPLKKMEAEAQ